MYIYMVEIVLRYLSILVWFYLLQSFHLGTLQVRWKFYDQFTSSSEEVSVTNGCQFHSVFETLRRNFLRILWSHKLCPSRNWISLALKIFFSIMVTSPPHPHTAFFYLYPFLKNLLSITKTLSLTIIESNIRAYINIEYFLKNIGHKTFCTHTYIRTYKSIHGTNKKNGGPYRRSVYNINSYGVISIH